MSIAKVFDLNKHSLAMINALITFQEGTCATHVLLNHRNKLWCTNWSKTKALSIDVFNVIVFKSKYRLAILSLY